MLKKLLCALLLISTSVQSQNMITGTLSPKNDLVTHVILYQLMGAKQVYISNSKLDNDQFKLEIPKGTAIGMYRLSFSPSVLGFVDFLFDQEDVSLKFDPTSISNTLEFSNSEENKTYVNYLTETANKRQKLDSLQIVFFKLKDKKQDEITNDLYVKTLNIYTKIQEQYEEKTAGKLANHFIRSNFKYYAPTLFTAPQTYLNSIKQHFFDFINFEDNALKNSTFFGEKAIEYVFYLNVSDDFKVQNGLYKKAINEVMQKVGENDVVKSEILTSLMYAFEQYENLNLVGYVIDDFYSKLPVTYKDEILIAEMQSKIKLAIGNKAPEITWEENGVQKKLSELNVSGAENYILVFWSTTCSHCLNEIPKLYEFSKNNAAIHVVAVALEDNNRGFEQYTSKLTAWTTILGLKKWENKMAKEYKIIATPTYFILDKDKRIVAKPEHFEDLKAFFEIETTKSEN
ncbi:MAG: TlpA family protein disulfide reductase [Flavobacteriaceae bacterium]|nr:TlpA family protein disulfide reductase [Flavobacteriaceae bacterium]